MNSFEKTYLKIIAENDDISLEKYQNILNPSYVGLNVFKILNEWIESPDLIEFPKELQINLCKKLRKRFDTLHIISFKEIINLLKKYDYEYLDDVIDGMKKYDALNNNYLIFINVSVDDLDNLEDNRTLNFIKTNFNDIYDNAYDIFSKIYNNRYSEGLTIFHRDEYDPENTYTCIFINRNASNMKDTLEHELTHFIHRVAKYTNKFPKTYSQLTPNKLKSKNLSCVDFITKTFKELKFSDQVCYALKEIVLRIFVESEEHPTIKSIINAFIRYYENDSSKFTINHLRKNIKQIEVISNSNEKVKFRLIWINGLLDKINSYDIFNENRESIETYFSKVQTSKNQKIEFILKCVAYLCFKKNYPEYDIDKIVKSNFAKFKFRDV